LEAAGVGLVVGPGDVAFRCNFATVAPGGDDPFALPLLDRRAGRIDAGTEALAAAVDGMELEAGVVAHLVPAAQFRAALLLRGPGLAPRVSDVDPGAAAIEEGLRPCRALDGEDTAADHTAHLVNRFVVESHRILRDHPVNRERRAAGLPEANCLLPRGAGGPPASGGLLRRYGVRAAVVSGDATVLGLARACGHTPVEDPRFTADPATDLAAKVAAAEAALADHDLVFLHVKGGDTLSHDRKPEALRDFLERVDRELAPLLTEERVVAVTGDHSTPCTLGYHSGDPVPALLAGPGGRRDGATRFAEGDCLTGGLGRIPARGLLWSLVDLLGFGRNYVPGDPL
ncbi:MAG: phosphoglycerate mutase, partial [Nitrospirae bacterium]